MRYCRFCRKITAGRPNHCSSCGRSYNVKLCRKGHVNPRGTRHCTTCGSTDLTLPQPRKGLGAVAVVATIFLVLTAGTAFFLTIFTLAAIRDPSTLLPLMLVGLGIGLLWLVFVSIYSLWE